MAPSWRRHLKPMGVSAALACMLSMSLATSSLAGRGIRGRFVQELPLAGKRKDPSSWARQGRAEGENTGVEAARATTHQGDPGCFSPSCRSPDTALQRSSVEDRASAQTERNPQGEAGKRPQDGKAGQTAGCGGAVGPTFKLH